MTKEMTEFKRYLCFITLEEKLYEVDEFTVALLKNKHPKKNVKYKYETLEELRLIKSQLLANNDIVLIFNCSSEIIILLTP